MVFRWNLSRIYPGVLYFTRIVPWIFIIPGICLIPSIYAFSGSLADVAREFDDVDFPGIEGCDAVAEFEGYTCLIQCVDEDDPPRKEPFTLQNFTYNPHRGVFLDPLEVYADVKAATLHLPDESRLEPRTIIEGAILASRYAPWDENYYRDYEILLV